MILGACLSISGNLLAHTDLAESSPANGAILHHSPETIELTFTEDVRLLRITLLNNGGQELELDFNPTAESESLFSLILPELPTDSYSLEWAVLGADSHRVEGEIDFAIDPSAEMQMGEMHTDGEQMDDHH